MRVISAAIGGFFVAVLTLIVVSLGAAGFTATEKGDTSASATVGWAFIGSWLVFGIVAFRARSARGAWRRSFVWMGLWSLAAPIATLLGSAGIASRSAQGQSEAYQAGLLIGGGAATVVVAVVAFFAAAIFFVLAWVLRGGSKRVVAEPTKRCPRCAETVLAAARVCRYCGNEFPKTAEPSVITGGPRGS